MAMKRILALLIVGTVLVTAPTSVWAARGEASAGAETAWDEAPLAAGVDTEANSVDTQSAPLAGWGGAKVGKGDADGSGAADKNGIVGEGDPQMSKEDDDALSSELANVYARAFKADVKESRRKSRIPVTRYAGKDYCLVFDARYYLRNNPDVDELVGGDYGLALKHFVLYGMRQRRQAIATFDVSAYYANYPELREEFGTDWPRYYRHYQTVGKAMGYVGTGRTGSKAAAKAAKAAREAEAARAAEEQRAREQEAAEQAAKEAAASAAVAPTTTPVQAVGNAASFIKAAAQVAEYARMRGMRYGNSSSAVPCEDGRISCDRLIARALWNMGYHDQPAGGVTVGNMDGYLLAHGFRKGTSFSDIRAGSIVMVVNNAGGMHCFAVASYDQATNTFVKYDEGSDARIQSRQPFVEPWAYKTLVAVYNWP